MSRMLKTLAAGPLNESAHLSPTNTTSAHTASDVCHIPKASTTFGGQNGLPGVGVAHVQNEAEPGTCAVTKLIGAMAAAAATRAGDEKDPSWADGGAAAELRQISTGPSGLSGATAAFAALFHARPALTLAASLQLHGVLAGGQQARPPGHAAVWEFTQALLQAAVGHEGARRLEGAAMAFTAAAEHAALASSSARAGGAWHMEQQDEAQETRCIKSEEGEEAPGDVTADRGPAPSVAGVQSLVGKGSGSGGESKGGSAVGMPSRRKTTRPPSKLPTAGPAGPAQPQQVAAQVVMGAPPSPSALREPSVLGSGTLKTAVPSEDSQPAAAEEAAAALVAVAGGGFGLALAPPSDPVQHPDVRKRKAGPEGAASGRSPKARRRNPFGGPSADVSRAGAGSAGRAVSSLEEGCNGCAAQPGGAEGGARNRKSPRTKTAAQHAPQPVEERSVGRGDDRKRQKGEEVSLAAFVMAPVIGHWGVQRPRSKHTVRRLSTPNPSLPPQKQGTGAWWQQQQPQKQPVPSMHPSHAGPAAPIPGRAQHAQQGRVPQLPRGVPSLVCPSGGGGTAGSKAPPAAGAGRGRKAQQPLRASITASIEKVVLAGEWQRLRDERRTLERDMTEFRQLVNSFANLLLHQPGHGTSLPLFKLMAADPDTNRSLHALLSKVLGSDTRPSAKGPSPPDRRAPPSGPRPAAAAAVPATRGRPSTNQRQAQPPPQLQQGGRPAEPPARAPVAAPLQGRHPPSAPKIPQQQPRAGVQPPLQPPQQQWRLMPGQGMGPRPGAMGVGVGQSTQQQQQQQLSGVQQAQRAIPPPQRARPQLPPGAAHPPGPRQAAAAGAAGAAQLHPLPSTAAAVGMPRSQGGAGAWKQTPNPPPSHRPPPQAARTSTAPPPSRPGDGDPLCPPPLAFYNPPSSQPRGPPGTPTSSQQRSTYGGCGTATAARDVYGPAAVGGSGGARDVQGDAATKDSLLLINDLLHRMQSSKAGNRQPSGGYSVFGAQPPPPVQPPPPPSDLGGGGGRGVVTLPLAELQILVDLLLGGECTLDEVLAEIPLSTASLQQLRDLVSSRQTKVEEAPAHAAPAPQRGGPPSGTPPPQHYPHPDAAHLPPGFQSKTLSSILGVVGQPQGRRGGPAAGGGAGGATTPRAPLPDPPYQWSAGAGALRQPPPSQAATRESTPSTI